MPSTLNSDLSERSDAASRDILDTHDGIDRVMGDRDLYARMLRRFRHDYAGCTASIRVALHGGDRTLAHRLAHTLKGASGMIGAHRVHQQSIALERAIRLNIGNEDDESARLEAEMASLLQRLDSMLDEDAPPSAMPPDLPDATTLVSNLASLLSHGDGAAIDLLESAAPSLRSMLGAERFEEVHEAAQRFDFEAALAALGHH